MKTPRHTAVWRCRPSLLILLVLCGLVQADVPRLIHYQGKLRNIGGPAANGNVSLRFRLYDDPTSAGPAVFDETHPTVAVANGLLSVLIGSQTPGGVPDSALDAPAIYLGIAVDGGAELQPRIRIASNPHAIKAGAAERLVRPGTFTPAAQADASGNVAVTGSLRVAADASACTAANAGAIRWDGSHFQGCNGSTWVNLDNLPPSVGIVNPSSGPAGGGTAITISGENFQSPVLVTIGGASATSVVVNSSSEITAVTPTHAAGAVDVRVTNPDGLTGTLVNGFTYVLPGSSQDAAAPSCKNILDNSGSIGDGLYWLDPDGGSTANAFQAYCDMSTSGGGWTLVSKFSQHQSNQTMAQATYDAYYKGNLWIDGFSEGIPTSPNPTYDAFHTESLDWSPFMQTGSPYSLRMTVFRGAGSLKFDVSYDFTYGGYTDQNAAPEANRSWVLTNRTVHTDTSGISWHTPGETVRFWLPIKPGVSGNVWMGCSSSYFGDGSGCSLNDGASRRYGNAGIIGATGDSNDPAPSWAPHTNVGGAYDFVYVHQATATHGQSGQQQTLLFWLR